MSSGWSALVLCILLGHRLGFKKEIMVPHSMVLCMVGTGLLWVGWYGFNAGSALAPDGIAANAFMSTTLATAVASFTWAMLEYALRGKPSAFGVCSGAVGTSKSNWDHDCVCGGGKCDYRRHCQGADWPAHCTGDRAAGARYKRTRRRRLYDDRLIFLNAQRAFAQGCGVAGAQRLI